MNQGNIQSLRDIIAPSGFSGADENSVFGFTNTSLNSDEKLLSHPSTQQPGVIVSVSL